MNTQAISAVEALNTAIGGVLGRMTSGLLATFVTAAVVASLGLAQPLFSTVFGYVIIFAPLAMSLYLAWKADKLSKQALQGWFFAFALVMGLSLSLLFATFTTASIAQALVGTVISFGALAGWGYFTKRDLSSWGPFLFAGVIGLIVASVIGVFVGSTALQLTINVLAIVIFLGLTAYDMNRIRDMFWNSTAEEIDRTQWLAALSLYINFINIFTSLLQLTGEKE